MPNRYRRPLVLNQLRSAYPPSECMDWLGIGTCILVVHGKRNPYTVHLFNLIGLGAN